MGLSSESKNNIKIVSLILITMFILYILHISIGSYLGVEIEGARDNIDPNIIFEKSLIDKTLTVVEIYPEDITFYWPEISVVSGSADLPYDAIEIGNIITNCDGDLKLEHTPTGKIICEEDFD